MDFLKIFHHHDLKKGIFLVLLAWVCFSTMYMISKLIGQQTTVSTMIFFRSIMGLALTVPWILRSWPKCLEIKHFKVLFLRSFTGLFNLLFIFLAVKKISLLDTTLLNNSAPFFVPFILWFWLRAPINHKAWPAIVIGFIGIALLLHPDGQLLNIGTIYALASGVCLAFTIVTTRLTAKSENLTNFLLYFFAIGTLASLPFAAVHWKISSGLTLVALLSIGVLSWIGQVLFFYALKYGKAHQLAPFTYSAVLFSGIYEWAIWGKAPNWIGYIGMALIIAAGVWIVYINPPKKE